jgi:hypothetical protein
MGAYLLNGDSSTPSQGYSFGLRPRNRDHGDPSLKRTIHSLNIDEIRLVWPCEGTQNWQSHLQQRYKKMLLPWLPVLHPKEQLTGWSYLQSTHQRLRSTKSQRVAG